MTEETRDSRAVKPFAEFLAEQRGGHTAAELSASMNELIEAVTLYGKPGTLTLTVKVKPAGSGYSPSVLVTDDIRLKAPMGERPPSVFFVDRDGNLTRSDPNQPVLPLREVGDREAREVSE